MPLLKYQINKGESFIRTWVENNRKPVVIIGFKATSHISSFKMVKDNRQKGRHDSLQVN